LFYHLSFGFLHYFRYIFVFIIPRAVDSIKRTIKEKFFKPKRPIEKTFCQTPIPYPGLPPQPIQKENKANFEEKPTPIKNTPKKRPSIYDI
jgi:hypothetical protein